MTKKRAWYNRWPVFRSGRVQVKKGGPTSGHRGHRGIPGKRGGSLPGATGRLLSTPGGTPVVSSEPLGMGKKGINSAAVVEFEDGSKAIWKDEDMRYGSVESEVLAYELSESIGWSIVPGTREFELEGKRGSLQAWVPDSSTAYQEGIGLDPVASMRDFQPATMTVFDCLTDNTDRHSGNVLFGRERTWAIDNGGAFGTRTGGKGTYGSRAMGRGQYSLKDNPLKGDELAAVKDLKTWKGSARYNGFMGKLEKTYGSDHVTQFNKNLDTLIGMGE